MHDYEAQVDITKLRYVLYARKSTEDEGRQVRSIADQIADCEKLGNDLGIKIVRPYIKETKSAKLPDKRPQFLQLLKDIRSKKYDGIICWHPDRLARNMIEAGQIIDMLDNKIIKDLRFVSHQFSNDANGKMLLGMLFVFSKHYSDDLSAKVNRGIRGNLRDGKSSGTYKHGYIRDEQGFYRPDGKNFELIREAWQMRKNGRSLEAIANYMTEQGYARTYKEKAAKAGQRVYMSDKILSDRVFPDPFYYGVLIQKSKQVDLRDIPGYDFSPATDVETYNYIQSLTGRRVATERKRAVFKPLVSMVICYYCKSKMYPQTPQSGRRSEKKRILSYRCDAINCPRKAKELRLHQSVRAIIIFRFMYEMMNGLKVTREDYDKLCKRLANANRVNLQEGAKKIHSRQGALKAIEREIKERSLKIIKLDLKSTVYKSNEAHITDLELQRQDLVDEIGKIQARQTDPLEDMMSFEEFLNVANNAELHLKAADVAAKDRIARLIYLNVTVDDQNVVDYQMREPFKTYFQMHKISHGRGDRT